jgi:hypothetical protein
MLPGLINLDFADVRTTMLDAGDAILGIGMGVGEHRATLAAEKAVASPLLETSVEGARSMLLSITGGPDLSLIEASEAAEVVRQAAHPEAEIIFGASVDEDMSEEVWITVIAPPTRLPGFHATGAPSYELRTRPGRRLRPSATRPGGHYREPLPRTGPPTSHGDGAGPGTRAGHQPSPSNRQPVPRAGVQARQKRSSSQMG